MFVDLYRLETAEGEGIYFGGKSAAIPFLGDDKAFKYNDYRPLPSDDGIPAMQRDEYCAFESIEAMIHWMQDLSKFAKYDIHLCRYRIHVQHVRYGKRQCVFRKKFAVKLEAVNVF